MRASHVFFAALSLSSSALAACNDRVRAGAYASPPSASVTEDATPPAITDAAAIEAEADASHERAAMPTAPIGKLSHPERLARVYEKLAELDAHKAISDLTIVQYGDSHTASDYPTAVVRRALQERFGDGGRGFVALGQPWSGYVIDGVKTSMKDFDAERMRRKNGAFIGDGRFGLLGIAVGTAKPGAIASAEVAARASRVDVVSLDEPAGGSFDVLVDGAKVGAVSTKGAAGEMRTSSFEVDPKPHTFAVRAAGDGHVRVLGMFLDRKEPGVVLDTVGINGAQIHTILRWNEAHWADALKKRAPDLLVFAYGTNESFETHTAEEYEQKLTELLARADRAVPSAACLLLGPPDRAVEMNRPVDGGAGSGTWVTPAKLLEVVASQRKVAERSRCAFYDQIAVMGGAGSMATWASEAPPRGFRDRVHLTREGYAALGRAFASDLVKAYEIYVAR